MSRATIKLEKGVYYPGECVNGEVIYELDKEIKVRNIEVAVVCGEHTSIEVRHHSGYGRHRHSHYHTYSAFSPVVAKQFVVAGEGHIPAGIKRYPLSFMLPMDALPSYQGSHARITYEVKTKADIPWGFDIEGGIRFIVGIPPQFVSRPPQPKVLYSNNAAGIVMPSASGMPLPLQSADDKPCFRVDISNDLVIAGQSLYGSITVANITDKLRSAQLKLIPVEYAAAQGYSQSTELTPAFMEIPATQLRNNQPVNFQIPVPLEAVSTYIGKISSLQWVLECNLDLAWATDITARTDIIVVNTFTAGPPQGA